MFSCHDFVFVVTVKSRILSVHNFCLHLGLGFGFVLGNVFSASILQVYLQLSDKVFES